MTIEFNCHDCGKLLRTSDEKAGRTATCPGCGTTLTVPNAAPGSAAEPAGEFTDSEIDAPGDFDRAFPSSAGRSSSQAEATKACPICGEQIKAAAIRCRFCGENIGAPLAEQESQTYYKPHRGTLILVFGILGFLFCPFFGIAAWVMGNEDLAEMAAGRMDPTGEGLTKAGKIFGIIVVVLLALQILAVCVIITFMGVAGGFQ